MARKQDQLRFPFEKQDVTFDDVVVTSSNRSAVTAIRSVETWPGNIMCVFGPPRCGLGHLLYLWAGEHSATLIDAAQFDAMTPTEIEAFADQNGAIDLADQIKNDDNLLMALNVFSGQSHRLLLSARSSPSAWPCPEGDLSSRLRAIPSAKISSPDDDMMIGRLMAGCRQRFIKLEVETAQFVAMRLQRSYVAIEDFIDRLDAAISETNRGPSIQLAKSVLESEELSADDN